VRAGPYRLIRHPGYAGALLMWLGAILATRNWITLVVVGVSITCVYLHRITTEERMLASALGDDYRAYIADTKRIIPLIW
jgi:protein-S-isoprenylcysteine O-methyltransferase